MIQLVIIIVIRKERKAMATLKYSRQREAIKEYLMSTKEHPTADTVYMHIRQENPNISLGTVYRNLNLLTELGEIKRLSCGDGSDRFDATTEQHYHVLCKSCNRVFDLDIEPLNEINKIANEAFAGSIDGHSILFNGTCDECKNK